MTRHEQAQEALRLANDTYRYRAAVKRAVATGERDADAVLLDPDPRLSHMKVQDLLLAVPGVGVAVARRIRQRCHLSETVTLESLSPATRARLAVELRRHRAGPHAVRAFGARVASEKGRSA